MSSIAGAEVDPLFLKAIHLLRSKHPESAKQLDNLVQEYREKTYGVPAKRSGDDGKGSVDHPKANSNKSLETSHNKTGTSKQESKSASPITLMGKQEEITNIRDEKPSPNIKEEEVEEITVGSSLEPAHKKQRLQSKVNVPGASSISESDTHDNIPIDDIIEMDFLSDGLGSICKICHLNKRSEADNLLVECSECRSFFHQQCHKPQVSTKDLNDPRLIWYCSRCTKKMNKEMAAQQQQQQTATSSSGKSTNETPAKVTANPFQQAKPFRRNIPITTDATKSQESSKTESVKNTAAPTPVTEPSISSREGSPSSKQRPREQPRDVTVNSMKRLEMVKKRAKQNMQNIMKQSSRK